MLNPSDLNRSQLQQPKDIQANHELLEAIAALLRHELKKPMEASLMLRKLVEHSESDAIDLEAWTASFEKLFGKIDTTLNLVELLALNNIECIKMQELMSIFREANQNLGTEAYFVATQSKAVLQMHPTLLLQAFTSLYKYACASTIDAKSIEVSFDQLADKTIRMALNARWFDRKTIVTPRQTLHLALFRHLLALHRAKVAINPTDTYPLQIHILFGEGANG